MERAVSDELTSPAVDRPPLDEAFAAGAAHVDGRYVPIDEARIPITDTGFSRSDATYDVVAVWGGSFFRLEEHLDRFERSCRALRLRLPHDRAEVRAILAEVVALSGLRGAYVKMVCTRGVSREGRRDPRVFDNRFYAYAVPYVWLLPHEDFEAGMDVVVVRSVHRIPTMSVDPTVKNHHWGDLVRGMYEAYDRGARWPILLDAKGAVAEGPGYNVFALVDDELLTPETGVLEGVTRRTVMELAGQEAIAAHVVTLPEEALRRASELFATSTAGGVMPITKLDGEPIGDGTPGPITRRLHDLYWAAHEDPRYTTPIAYEPR